MSNQLQLTGGAKVRDLQDVIIGTSGVLSSVAFDVANGVPRLDVNGKILVSQLPNSVMEYKGTWNAATNTPTLVNGTGNQGDVYLCNVAGTVDFGAGPIVFFVGDQVIYSGSIWQRASGATGSVTSVAITESGDSLNITGSPITTSGTINIGFNGTNLQYVNGAGNLTTFPDLTGYVTAVSGTAPVVSSGGTTPAISMAAATASIDGYLTAANFVLFNNKQAAFTVVNPLTYNTLTNELNINMASTTVSGWVSFTDFTTFNNKQNAITLTTTGTSGASTLVGATLNIPNYGSALTGYVPYTGATANVDLGTFNLTADVITGATGSFASSGGSDTFAINHSSGAGIALNITKGGNGEGLYINKTSGSGNAATIIGTLNATTLVKSGGTSSQFLKADGTVDSSTYALDSLVVHLAGTETITGAKTFSGGVTFTSSVTTNNITFANSGFFLTLQPPTLSVNRTVTLPNGTGTLALTSDISYPVTSVFGRTGAVVATSGDYTTAQVTESGNLYYTDTRARLALSFAAGMGAYNSATGVITIPTNNNQITNGSNYIALTSLSVVGPLLYDNTTGVFNINQASTTVSGWVSFTDFTTFNNKQGTITLTTTGTSGAATFSSNTLNIPDYGGALSGYLPLAGGTLTGALSGTSASFSARVLYTTSGLANGGMGVEYDASSPRIALNVNSNTGKGYLGWNVTQSNDVAENYLITGAAGQIKYNNAMLFNIAASGTAGNPITWTTALTIASTGAATFFSSVTAGGTFRTTGGVFQLFNSTTFLGGLYPYATWLGSGSDYTPTLASASGLYFATNDSSTIRMSITSGGNVLIGTTDNGGKLVSYTTTAATQIKAAGTAPAITFSNTVLSPTIGGVLGVATAADQFFTGTASSDMILANQFTAGALIFGTSNLARMRISAAGIVGIGDTGNSSFKLSVTGTGGGVIANSSGAGDANFLSNSNSIGKHFLALSGASTVFYVIQGGGVYSTSATITLITSDRNLKTDIVDYDKGLAEVLSMKPRYYKYKDNLQKQEIGFIAQEMDEALKGSMIDSIVKNKETNENYKTYQLEWYPILVNAIKEQQKQIEELKLKIK